jgi:hypothetical protein
MIPIAIVRKLRERLTDPDLFRLVSDVLPDVFLFRCFLDYSDLFRILIEGDLVSIFPFVAVRCYVLQALKNKIDPEAVATIISQIGLPSLLTSNRIVSAVIDPIFEHIYDIVLNDRLPYLEMSAEQLEQVIGILTSMIRIMKDSVAKTRIVQTQVLSRLQKLLAKRSFEPKGLCFTWYGFLYDRGIIHDGAFNTYLQLNAKWPTPGKSSVILELNTFLLTLIPGPFPDIGKEPQPATKKVPSMAPSRSSKT